jgi:hypothetical protein
LPLVEPDVRCKRRRRLAAKSTRGAFRIGYRHK